MDTGNITLTFNFTENDIESMDISINSKFNILTNQYDLNIKLDGTVVNDEVTSFISLEDYANYPSLEDAGIDIKQTLIDNLGNLDFNVDDLIPEM